MNPMGLSDTRADSLEIIPLQPVKKASKKIDRDEPNEP